MKVLLLDNYDSFTYNLYHYLEQIASSVKVMRNDEADLSLIGEYSHIVISPGPGLPAAAGITQKLIEHYYNSKPILGICLGCQALGEFFGADLYNQNEVAHGICRDVNRTEDNSWLLKDIPMSFKTGLYHSWAIDPENLSEDVKITARNTNNTVMAIEHKSLPIAGVQFHPESIMSEFGLKIIENWLRH